MINKKPLLQIDIKVFSLSYLKQMLPEIPPGIDSVHAEPKKLSDIPMEEIQSPSHDSFSLFNLDWQHLDCQFLPNNKDYQPTHTLHLEALDQSMENYQQHALLYQLSEKAQVQEDKMLTQTVERKDSKFKNDTKNIPKNFGKGIINFIQRNDKKIKQMLVRSGLNYNEFWKKLKEKKQSLYTIAELRAWWTDEKFGKPMRMISNLFFRKYSLSYIFNSRITSYGIHIKYRKILWESLNAPQNFDHIKKY